MAANSYWVDSRLRAQRVASRTLPPLAPVQDLSREIIGTRTEVRRRGGVIPSWVVFSTIILATFALCVTITMRTRAEIRAASDQYQTLGTQVEALRNTNAALAQEVHRLNNDPRAIESAARTRLNMVRANEIIVPVD
ncbi:MAG TPA: septum formation initiator family protein [Pyrinomonadaceae bacterium]|nr:septum formation initiator family protein [Pyrinomonadaceae bacterium]